MGIVDLKKLENVLGHRLTFDWDGFSPLAEYYRNTSGLRYIFTNFESASTGKREIPGRKRKTVTIA